MLRFGATITHLKLAGAVYWRCLLVHLGSEVTTSGLIATVIAVVLFCYPTVITLNPRSMLASW